MGLGEENVLFVGGYGKGTANRNTPCNNDPVLDVAVDATVDVGAVGTVQLVFDDDAADGVENCCEGVLNGTFRPVDSLSRCVALASQPRAVSGLTQGCSSVDRYEGLSPKGEWVLSIYDGDVDALSGRLLAWGLTFQVVPCDRQYAWSEMGASTAMHKPPERHDATAVAVDDSWFIFGGRTNSELNDLWRYDVGAEPHGHSHQTLFAHSLCTHHPPCLLAQSRTRGRT